MSVYRTIWDRDAIKRANEIIGMSTREERNKALAETRADIREQVEARVKIEFERRAYFKQWQARQHDTGRR